MSAAELAIDKSPERALEELKADAVAYVKTSVPDAIAALVPGDSFLDEMVERYVWKALRQAGVRV